MLDIAWKVHEKNILGYTVDIVIWQKNLLNTG